jgi:hypothetical protein
MAKVTKNNARNLPEPAHTTAPYGNITGLHYQFATNASGIMVDSDKATAVEDADVVVLGLLPVGFKLLDAKDAISDAFTASTTFDLGFVYVDGVDDAAVPEDDDYFFAAESSATAGVLRSDTGVAPVTLPKPAYLILTVGGADHASAGQMDIVVFAENLGPR